MADDDNQSYITEPARGAFALGVLTHIPGLLADPKSGGNITPAEMKTWNEWADKAPGLIRYAANTPSEAPQVRTSYRLAGIGLGVILGAVSFTKYIPGRWKWVSGTAAVGAAGAGLYIGSMADRVNAASAKAFPEYKQAVLSYADAIEKNPALRQQLAGYLSKSVTAEDIQSTGIEPAVALKAVEFGQGTPYLDIATLAQQRAEKPSDCKTCRFQR